MKTSEKLSSKIFQVRLEGADLEKLSREYAALFEGISERRAKRFLEKIQSGVYTELSLDQADSLAMLFDRSLETFFPREGTD